MSEKAHPFELSGMGVGPYTFLTMVEMPDLSENSASNFGCMNPYAEVQSYKMKAGAGTCACCGMAIRLICVVQDGNGDNWGVGSDCVLKTEEPSLRDAAKIAVAKRRNRIAADKREDKRQQQHAVWLASPCRRYDALNGETNAQYDARKQAESNEAAQKEEKRKEIRAELFKEVIQALKACQTEFHSSLANQLSSGSVSPRQAEYIAKAILGRRVKSNAEKYDFLVAIVQS